MLAISTATKTAYIGLNVGSKNFYASLDADCRQSEKIMQEIHKMLVKQNLELEDVGNFAVVIGPGSFTGLRIGSALIKGFCAALPNKKVVPIPTLDLMAMQIVADVKPKRDFSCYMNAQSGMFYAATYNKKGEKIVDEHLITAADMIKGKDFKFCLAEEGFLPYGITIKPETLLSKALMEEKEKKLISAKDISIKYIRRSQAEEKD